MRNKLDNKKFDIIFKNGRKVFTKYLVIYFMKNTFNINSYGVIASKKIGQANIRNKVKRNLREILRKNDITLKSFDLIVISKKNLGLNIKKITQLDIERDYLSGIKKIK